LPTLELKCSKEMKNKVLDHMAKMGTRYTSQSHFFHEAITEQINRDNSANREEKYADSQV